MVPISAWEGTRQDEVLHPGKSEMGMVNTEYKRYLNGFQLSSTDYGGIQYYIKLF